MRASYERKILEFISCHEKGVSVNQISSTLGITRQAVHRHLKKLESKAQVIKEGTGPTVVYRSVMATSTSLPDVVRTISQVFSSHKDVALITLFGSFARQTHGEQSDIDVLVWLRLQAQVSRHEIWQFWDEQTKKIPWADRVSLVIMRLAPEMTLHTLLLDLPEEHMVVLDRDQYFEQLKDAVEKWRKFNGTKRIESFGGKHGWIYSDAAEKLSDIDFTLRINDVA